MVQIETDLYAFGGNFDGNLTGKNISYQVMFSILLPIVQWRIPYQVDPPMKMPSAAATAHMAFQPRGTHREILAFPGNTPNGVLT